MIINYNVSINTDNQVEFTLNSATDVTDFQDGFLTVVSLGAGFFGRLGYGELLLMINEESNGVIVSPTYESESDRTVLVEKIHNSMSVVNG